MTDWADTATRLRLELDKAEAERDQLRAALERHHGPMIRTPGQVGCGYCGLPLEDASGGQTVGTCRPGCVPNCPGSSHDGNKSASDLLLEWQVGDPIPRP